MFSKINIIHNYYTCINDKYNIMKWSEIKSRDRAKYIRQKVSEGYTSLDDIVNSFDTGGNMNNDTNWKSTPTVPWASYYDNTNLDSNNDETDWIEPGSEPHLDQYGNKVYTGAVSGLDIIPDSENPNIFYRADGLTLERTGTKPLDELVVTPANGNIDEYGNIFDANGKLIKAADMLISNNENWLQRNITRPVQDYFRELKYDIDNNNVIGGKYTLPAIGLAALLGSDAVLGAAGQVIDKAITPVYNWAIRNPITTKTAETALGSLFLGDVIDRRLINGENPTYGQGNNIFDSYVQPGLQDVMDASILFSGATKVPGIAQRVGSSVMNAGKTAYNYARNWRPFVPQNPNRYYRIVGETGDPIGDAIKSGVIRGPGAVPGLNEALRVRLQPGPNKIALRPKTYGYPMFGKGKPWSGSTSRMDFGKPTIIRSKADTGPIVWEESNKDFNHKRHAGIFRPSYNGDVNASPTEYFEYWEPRKFGYMRKDFTAPKFISELDWSPESWFKNRIGGNGYDTEDVAALISHIPEYHKIEKEAKANGTWLKMPDGSTWEGDPRSWVQMMSEDYDKYTKDSPFKYEPFAHSTEDVFDTFDISHFGKTDKGFYGRGFYTHPAENINGQLVGRNSYGDNNYLLTTNAQNPLDLSSQDFQYAGLFNQEGKTNAPEGIFDNYDSVYYGIPGKKMVGASPAELVVPESTNYKSLLGNNGNFNSNDPNIYKALIPFIAPAVLSKLNNNSTSKALGGPINTDNPIPNFAQNTHQQLPEVRYDLGGTLFAHGGDTKEDIRNTIAQQWPATNNIQYDLKEAPDLVQYKDNNGNAYGTIETIVPNQIAAQYSPYYNQVYGQPFDQWKYMEEPNRVDYRDYVDGQPVGLPIEGFNYLTTNNPGMNTVVYNPNYTTAEDIKQDLLHVMHDDPTYENLYDAYYTEAINDPKFLYHDINEGDKESIQNMLEGNYGNDMNGILKAADAENMLKAQLDGYLRDQYYPGTVWERQNAHYAGIPFNTTYNPGLTDSINNIKNYLETGRRDNGGVIYKPFKKSEYIGLKHI